MDNAGSVAAAPQIPRPLMKVRASDEGATFNALLRQYLFGITLALKSFLLQFFPDSF